MTALFAIATLLGLLLLAAPPQAEALRLTTSTSEPDRRPTPLKVVYGKYAKSDNDTNDNAYYLFKPSVGEGPWPVIIYFHPGGFVSGGGPPSFSPALERILDNGIAYISVNYRLIATRYYYKGDDDSMKLEELVHVDEDGMLRLDTDGKTMADYKVRTSSQEFTTKCYFDAVQAINHMIEHSTALELDLHRLVFQGVSAGGGMINYLTWVYYQRGTSSYTPRGIVYHNGQLDYPATGPSATRWGLVTSHVGETFPLNKFTNTITCAWYVGDVLCPGSPILPAVSEYDLCNVTLQEQLTRKLCGSDFDTATVGDAASTSNGLANTIWPDGTPPGFAKMWYNSVNMAAAARPPSPFYLYVACPLNGTSMKDLPHLALHAQSYGEVAEKAGINYTVYYSSYAGMIEERTEEQVPSSDGCDVYNYKSNFQWRKTYQGDPNGDEEWLAYACMAIGKECKTNPSSTNPESNPKNRLGLLNMPRSKGQGKGKCKPF